MTAAAAARARVPCHTMLLYVVLLMSRCTLLSLSRAVQALAMSRRCCPRRFDDCFADFHLVSLLPGNHPVVEVLPRLRECSARKIRRGRAS